jgi:hypothetical protein
MHRYHCLLLNTNGGVACLASFETNTDEGALFVTTCYAAAVSAPAFELWQNDRLVAEKRVTSPATADAGN